MNETVRLLVKLARGKGTEASMLDFLLSKKVKEVYTGDGDKELNILQRLDMVLDRIEEDFSE